MPLGVVPTRSRRGAYDPTGCRGCGRGRSAPGVGVTGDGMQGTGPVGLAGGWSLERRTGDAASLHDAPVEARRIVRVHAVERPALVLGSTQAATDVDDSAARRRGVDVVRRRSGGGAVFLAPGAQLWVDVVVPAGDPLHDDDVERASWWVGDWWSAALASGAGWTAADGHLGVHRSSLGDRSAGRIACFASVGPGEVVVERSGAVQKLVGISQRRTRWAARFQTVAHTRWDAGDLLGLLDPAVASRVAEPLRTRVAPAVDGVNAAERLLDTLLRTLPA